MESRTAAVLATLVVYKIALVGIGLWARRRTRDSADFFLGGRRLGPWVAALSASASSSSAWTLLGVSGAAWLWGISAVWLFPATVGGFLINWVYVAPRLMARSRATGSLTLSESLAGPPGAPFRGGILRLASLIIFVSFIFYIAAQFQAAGHAFAATFGLAPSTSVLIGATLILIYTLLGGFWAVSVTDTLQGLLMAATAVILPAAALLAVGGPGALLDGLAATGDPGLTAVTGRHAGAAALFFIAGTLGIGLGYPGQPHVVNRFMALRDHRALAAGRVIAVAWAVVLYAGMLLLGWCGRVLYADLPRHEEVFFTAAQGLLPPVIAGITIAAVLSAIMSTADSQLLVAVSSVSHDLAQAGHGGSSLTRSRISLAVLSLMAAGLALFLPAAIFSRVLFAWHAVGSAFGPVLLVQLAGRPVRPGWVLASMLAGFAGTLLLHLAAGGPGDAAERLLPWAAALALALAGSRCRQA